MKEAVSGKASGKGYGKPNIQIQEDKRPNPSPVPTFQEARQMAQHEATNKQRGEAVVQQEAAKITIRCKCNSCEIVFSEPDVRNAGICPCVDCRQKNMYMASK